MWRAPPHSTFRGSKVVRRVNSPFSQLTSALHIFAIFGYVVKKILFSWVKLVASHYALQKANSLCRQKSSLAPEMPTLLVVSNSVHFVWTSAITISKLKNFQSPLFLDHLSTFLGSSRDPLPHTKKTQLPETFRTEWLPIVAVRLQDVNTHRLNTSNVQGWNLTIFLSLSCSITILEQEGPCIKHFQLPIFG